MTIEFKCSTSAETFVFSEVEQQLYEKFDLALPDKSPIERWRLLLSFRNSHKYFWRKCSQTNEKIYSMYAPSSPFKVVSIDCWMDRSSEVFTYQLEVDRRQPFLTQLQELWHYIPRPATSLRNIVLSLADQARGSGESSYLVFDSSRVTACLYGLSLRNCQRCMDCYFVDSCSDCYECVDCVDSKGLFFSEHCGGCHDSFFLSNCRNCSDCMFCANLVDAKFCIFNKFVGEEKFRQFVKEQSLDSVVHLEQAKNSFQDFIKDNPIPSRFETDCQDCTGNYLHNCNTVRNGYELRNCRNVVNCYGLSDAESCVDGLGFGEGLSDSALFVDVGINSSFVFQSVECWNNVHHLRYCSHCEDSSNLFGCVGLRGKEYCILNKQYTKEDYFTTVDAIVRMMRAKRKWGKPLAPLFSGFAYNHSLAGELFPLSQAQATLMGYHWDERSDGIKPSQLLTLGDINSPIAFADLPDSLSGATSLDEVYNSIYLCEMTGRPFRIVKEEAQLLHAMHIAPPTRCFEQRHTERLKKLSLGRLYRRKDSEGDEILSAFANSWKRPVLAVEKLEKIIQTNSKSLQ